MVRFKIVRGLNRLAVHPEVELDGSILRQATEATLEAAFRLVHWRVVLERGALSDRRRVTPGHDLLARLLRDKEAHALERIFRLLALQHRGEDFKGIYRGLRNPSAKVKSGSRELLENLVRPPLRDPLIALIDDAPDVERLARAVPYYQARLFDYEELLCLILDQPGDSLRSIAAYQHGEMGLTAFRPRLWRGRPRAARQCPGGSPGHGHVRHPCPGARRRHPARGLRGPVPDPAPCPAGRQSADHRQRRAAAPRPRRPNARPLAPQRPQPRARPRGAHLLPAADAGVPAGQHQRPGRALARHEPCALRARGDALARGGARPGALPDPEGDGAGLVASAGAPLPSGPRLPPGGPRGDCRSPAVVRGGDGNAT